MSITVTFEPTFLKDRDAMGRLLGVLERKLGAGLADLALVIFQIAGALRANAADGKQTAVRIGYDNGRVWSEVLS